MQTKIKYVTEKWPDKIKYENSSIIGYILLNFNTYIADTKDYFPETGVIGFIFENRNDYNNFIIEMEKYSDCFYIKFEEKEEKVIWIKTISNKFLKQ